jgi:hypothetical protein
MTYDESGNDDLVMTGSDFSIESSTSEKPIVSILNTNADANGASLKLNKNGSSPATNDVVGNIDFISEDADNNVTTFGRIQSTIVDVTAGGEEGGLGIYVAENDGTLTKGMEIKGLSSNGNITVDISTHDGSAGGLMLASTLVTASAAELNYTDVTTLGTSQASKAVTVDSNGDLLVPDSDKYKFGAGSDMQLYHDGSNSYITNATGALKVDASLDIELSADGGNVTMDDGSTTIFDFNTDDPEFKIMDDAQVANYLSMAVGANGATTIQTVDADAAAANLTITADGTFEAIGTTITLDSGGAINLEPAAGSAILLDGTISVDAGVVTGATSITSTAFVGTLSTAAQANVTSLGSLTGLTVAGDATLTGTGANAVWDSSEDALEFGDDASIEIGDGLDMKLYHDGTNSYITNAQGALKIATETSGIAVTIGHGTSEVTVADNLNVTGALLYNSKIVSTKSNGTTLAASESGSVILQSTNSSTITLPATVAGLRYTFVWAGTAGQTFNISPNSSDKIMGSILDVADGNIVTAASSGAGTDNKDLQLDGGSQVGDRVTLVADGDSGWYIEEALGSWAFES